MRKIILSVAVSLDGFIEGTEGEYDWCPPPKKNEMCHFLDKIDTIFMGRKSFEVADLSFFPGKTCYVFSQTLKAHPQVEIIADNFLDKTVQIRNQPGKDIWLFGGAALTTFFINNNLVDEMWLGLVPVILGAGKPLFQGIEQRKHFVISSAKNSKEYTSLLLTKK